MPISQAAAMVIGAGVSAGGGIGSQLLGAHLDKRRDERANQFAIEQQNLANQQNIEFWNMQNEYNSPEAVMQRMRAAGLNPNLVYGQATQPSGSIAAAKAPQGTFTSQGNRPAQALGAIQESVQLAMQIKNMELLDAEIRKKDAEAKYMDGRYRIEMNEGEIWDSLYLDKLNYQNAKIWQDMTINSPKSMQARIERDMLQNNQQSRELASKMIEAKYRRIIAQTEGENLINKLRQLEVDLNKTGLTKSDPIYWRVVNRIINYLIETEK